IADFAVRLLKYAEEYGVPDLEEYAYDLSESAHEFNIENIIRALKKFPFLIKSYKI
ncbi:MAG: hypothetical protein GY757_22325, partial [bacterium]|nr:hypothetical protein [bacterium]